jgi:hypothetical protein
MRIVVAAVAALLAATPGTAMACQQCFGGGVNSPTTYGITMAMLALVLTTGFVGGGIAAFFVNVRKRTRMLEPGELVVTDEGDLARPENETSSPR